MVMTSVADVVESNQTTEQALFLSSSRPTSEFEERQTAAQWSWDKARLPSWQGIGTVVHKIIAPSRNYETWFLSSLHSSAETLGVRKLLTDVPWSALRATVLLSAALGKWVVKLPSNFQWARLVTSDIATDYVVLSSMKIFKNFVTFSIIFISDNECSTSWHVFLVITALLLSLTKARYQTSYNLRYGPLKSNDFFWGFSKTS